jgi:hypothetical protein
MSLGETQGSNTMYVTDDIDWDEIIRELDEAQAKKQRDKEHTYVIDIMRVLHGQKWGMRKVDLDAAVYEKRFVDGEPMPKKFSETIQSVLNNYTSQSLVFRKAGKTPEDDLFYSPKGKGSGTWALHSERAALWLQRRIGMEI